MQPTLLFHSMGILRATGRTLGGKAIVDVFAQKEGDRYR